MTGETLDLRSDKRKPREEREEREHKEEREEREEREEGEERDPLRRMVCGSSSVNIYHRHLIFIIFHQYLT